MSESVAELAAEPVVTRKRKITRTQKLLLARLKIGQQLRCQKSDPHYFIDGATQ